MPVLLRGRRRAEGWLTATSETRMGSTCPTNEKGIKRKVVVRSWIVREWEWEWERDRDRERARLHRCSRRSLGFATRGTIDERRGKCCEREGGRSDHAVDPGRRKSWILNQAIGWRSRWSDCSLSKSCANDNHLSFLHSAGRQLFRNVSLYHPAISSVSILFRSICNFSPGWQNDSETRQSIVRARAATEIKARNSPCGFVISNRGRAVIRICRFAHGGNENFQDRSRSCNRYSRSRHSVAASFI